jgi:hypothetical protein
MLVGVMPAQSSTLAAGPVLRRAARRRVRIAAGDSAEGPIRAARASVAIERPTADRPGAAYAARRADQWRAPAEFDGLGPAA